MEEHISPALAYIDRWLEFQMRMSQQPGCAIAVAHAGGIVFERAYGHADLGSEIPLTPRHRMRAASHTKSFTAAGILKLREAGKLKLDDPVGSYVPAIHPAIAQSTIGQLLSHSAGVVRDGTDAGQFHGRRPFLTAEELRTELQTPPVVEANTRFKYSNAGFALLGMVIEAITGEPYPAWIKREIVERAGLTETSIDMPSEDGPPIAVGHSGKLLLGKRVGLSSDYT
ncbi:MAG: serine hydrolase domain-containing protein, partial [Methyloligellaceae bacterium]